MSKNHQNYQSTKGNSYEIHGGEYTGYSAQDSNGNRSAQGFDSPGDVKGYIESQESGNESTPDTVSFGR